MIPTSIPLAVCCATGWASQIHHARLTHFYAEVNALHPFPEGNGRTRRAFCSQLARHAGWPIDWSGLDAERNTQASIASLRGDSGPLQAMLDDVVSS